MIRILPLPDQSTLTKTFCYDPISGTLFRRKDGSVAGSKQGQVRVDGILYSTPRIIWKLVHDEEPPEIDHRDLDHANNRLLNLRPATTSQNCMNKRASSLSRTGIRGVGFKDYVSGRVFWAVIYENGRRHELGHFSTFEAAVAARKRAEILYHKEYVPSLS